MPTYTATINGREYVAGSTIEIDGNTARFGVASDVPIEGFDADGNWTQGRQENGVCVVDLPLGQYWKIITKHAGGLHGYMTSFTLVKKAATPAMPTIGANPVTTSTVPTTPRTGFGASGFTLVRNLDKPGTVVEGIRITAGGVTTGPDGRTYPSAGYGFQVSASDCTIRKCEVLVPFSEYFVYIRPGLKNILIEDCLIRGGTNFEASIRNAGSQVTIRNCTVIQDHYGIDNKRARTLLRGYGDWTIENSIFAGGAFGPTPMSRGNAGLGQGFFELFRGRGDGNMATSEGGQLLIHQGSPQAVACANAAVAAREAGKSRRDIVRAAFVASGIAFTDSDIDDTLWNREMSLSQRSTAKIRNCRFEVSPDGKPVTINVTAGTSIDIADCVAFPETQFNYEYEYPEVGAFLSGCNNTIWTMPGDIVRPAPKMIANRFQVGTAFYSAPTRAAA